MPAAKNDSISKDNQSDSVKLFDRNKAEIAAEELIVLMFGKVINNSSEIENEVDEILSMLISQDKSYSDVNRNDNRRKVQELMHAMDTEKVEYRSIKLPQVDDELLQDVIASKPSHDRFKSDFKKSRISAQMLKVLLSNNSCIDDWITSNFAYHDHEFHLHSKSVSDQQINCDISITIPTTTYFAIQSKCKEEGIELRLCTTEYRNYISNLLVQTGPNWSKLKFSPKIGISRPRTKDRVVLDSNVTTFEKNLPEDHIRISIPMEVVYVYNAKGQTPRDVQKLTDLRILDIMEKLLQSKVCNSYEYSNFEDMGILFISADLDQEEAMITKSISSESQELLGTLNHALDLHIAILVE